MAIEAPAFAFVFVCHGGELEIKSLLLAASLRETFGDAPELIAAVPQPAAIWREPSSAALEMLRCLRVDVRAVENPIGAEYPIGNKLACLGVPARARTVVVLDSDILCLRGFDNDPAAAAGFAAKPADKRTFPGDAEVWASLYAAAGTTLPETRVATTLTGEAGPPYFNSGVVFTTQPARLGAAWIECARTLNPILETRGQRHWLDQVALPVAVRRCGLDYACLGDDFNFPAHLKPLPEDSPVFCHYHWPEVIAREPRLRERVRALAARHAELRAAIAADAEGAPLLRESAWRNGHARDIDARELSALLIASAQPRLLNELVATSREAFGFFPAHAPRAVEYPWVLAALQGSARDSRILDVGAGVNALPLALARRGARVTTVDSHPLVRDPRQRDGWNEWGFLDYAAFDANIRSFHAAYEDWQADAPFDAIYSVSVIEHLRASVRARWIAAFRRQLRPDGLLLLSVDLVPGSEALWNRSEGVVVEDAAVHGDLAGLCRELAQAGFRIDATSTVRDLPRSNVDLALIRACG
ncbi:MAG: class I SAM-dependent methyltransferase [Deltaproteobacteria bacterium]